MKTIRRYWRSLLVVCVLVFCGTAWFWHRAEARLSFFGFMMLQENPQTPVTAAQRDAVLTVLNDLSLDRDSLVALNLSTSQAESVVSTARTWQQNNQAALTTQMNTIHQKRQAVREIEKAIAIGPYDANRETALATARQELRNAESAYRTTLSSLETSIHSVVSASQRIAWTAIKTGHGQYMPIRMLDLTDAQRLAVSDARHRYERQHAAASNEQERSAAVATWQGALDAILTAEQRTVMQGYNTNYAAASAAVANAYETVLPLVEQG